MQLGSEASSKNRIVSLKRFLENLKKRRDNIDQEIRQVTLKSKLNDALRRELFGAVAVCPKVDENFGARNLFWEMGVIYNKYKGHKEAFKHCSNVIRVEAQKLYSE